MRQLTGKLFALIFAISVARVSAAPAPEALVLDETHYSQVFAETRHFRIFLPGDYGSSGKRYPVIYWFHGWSERYNRPVAGEEHRNYDRGSDYGGDTIAAFVGTHDVIVVKWDGYNPRVPGEAYPRPYNISPVETKRQFPLYFPELVEYIDRSYRTIADREHRATAGLSMGGFMSFWIAGKYPHMVSSASNFMGSPEFFVGPQGFDVEYRHEEMRNNYDGVRTRLVMGTRDFIQFYHRQMNAIWNFTRPHHETEEFDADHGTPGMAKTLSFHMRAFADPLPLPAAWSHVDAYPSFSIWGWDVASSRRQPGFTVLENVSASGFRSCAREWLPGGRVLPEVKLWIASERLYPPRKRQIVTYIRLRDGQMHRKLQAADADGRLNFELDGEEYEVGIGSAPQMALAGSQVDGAAWATAGKPVRVRVRIWNKGALPSKSGVLRWETPNPGVRLDTPVVPLPALPSGKSVESSVSFSVQDEARAIVKLFAVYGSTRMPLEVPLFPPAAPATGVQIADDKTFAVFLHAVELTQMRLGEGNGDGRANPNERIAILLPDGESYRAAELFTNDRCVDNSFRISDVWSSYDHVGASAKYSLPRIRSDCPPGYRVRLLARVLLPNRPNHQVRYASIEFPIAESSLGPRSKVKPASSR